MEGEIKIPRVFRQEKQKRGYCRKKRIKKTKQKKKKQAGGIRENERQQRDKDVSRILEYLSLMHHTDQSNCHCYLHYTDLHVADVQSGSKQKEMEKKKIIKKNSNID